MHLRGLDGVRATWYRPGVRVAAAVLVVCAGLAAAAFGGAALVGADEGSGAGAPGAKLAGTQGGETLLAARGQSAAATAPRTLTIVATGDLLIHQPVWARAYQNGGGHYDFRPMFRAMRPTIGRAALAFCHVETPMAPGAPSGYPVFRTPPALARAIAWVGFDACSTASNHSVDQGRTGIRETLRALDRAGVRHTGTARTAREARRILVLEADGIRVALLSATYGTNGIPVPDPWNVNLIRPDQLLRHARRARRLGADVVVVNLHWGAEYVHAPTAEQLRVARALLRSRAVDVIVGQHAHVVQPIRRMQGRFVVFGEGNFLSAQSTACCPGPTQDGLAAVLRVRVADDDVSVVRADYVPIYVRRPDYVVVPVGRRLRQLAAAGRSGSAEASALRASRQRTVSVVGQTRWTRPLPGRAP
jgi:poly-gamma-glutamate capsule biosynthesis protein CapA/YwtB (metallophosphatase superfamily)